MLSVLFSAFVGAGVVAAKHQYVARAREGLENLPTFFIIGAQKAGTTALYDLLITHPEVCSYGRKEKHFFSADEERWRDEQASLSGDFYGEFAGCSGHRFTADSTPSYSFLDYTARRIRQFYPPALVPLKKFILLIREPVSRQYSEYQRLARGCLSELNPLLELSDVEVRDPSVREGLRIAVKKCADVSQIEDDVEAVLRRKEKVSVEQILSFGEWIDSSFGRKQLARGRYLEHITNWLAEFDRRQLFILDFETLISNTTDSVERLSNWLGIEDTSPLHFNGTSQIRLPQVLAGVHSYTDEAVGMKLDCKTAMRLEAYFSEKNQGLAAYVNNNQSQGKSSLEPIFHPFASVANKCVNV